MKKLPAIILCCLLSLSAMAELRLALIPLDEASRKMADLALAELSNDDDLAFLERAEIAAIEKEIKLSALSDFVPDPLLMQNTQLFILLKHSQLIAFDSTTGVRLEDQKISSQQELLNAIRDAVAKQRSFGGDTLYKLSAMPLVPIHLSDNQTKFARQLEETFLQLICNKKDVALLERRHLLFLLNEPNAQEKGLTDKLFAGTNILKPSAVSNGKNGIILKLQFFSPDGKTQIGETQATFAKQETLAEDCHKFLETLTLPAPMQEDKRGEARDFINEAWFAIRHGLTADAVASGTSAFALDKEYDMELARIAFHSVARVLSSMPYRLDSTIMDVALNNMRLGTTLAEKHGGFTQDDTFFATNAIQSMWYFRQIDVPQAQKDVANDLMERCILLRKKQLDKELLTLADSPGPRWPDALFKLETRCWYVYELDTFCNLPWDLHWWEQIVYPVLAKTIADAKDLQPEMERFSAMEFKDKHPIVSNPKIKALRVKINRQKALLDLNLFLNFVGRLRIESLSQENREIYRRASELLISSNLIDYALQGLNGLMQLRTNQTMRQRVMGPDFPKDLAFFYKQYKRILEQCIKIDNKQPWFHSIWSSADPDFLKQKLDILETAIKKFNLYSLCGDNLLDGYEQWDDKTAKIVYDKLIAFEAESQRIFDKNSRPNRLSNKLMKDYFRNQRKKLETKFGIQPAVADTTPIESPYAAIYTPLKERPRNASMVVVGYENKSFYIVTFEKDTAFLLQIDSSNMQVSEVANIKKPGNYGRMFGAILDDYYAALHGQIVYLFLKDGSQPEIIDFKDYCKKWCHGMAGCGERLFFTFDGQQDGSQTPGTLLEYNVRTKEKKLLASTLDRSVKWPLQGIGRPYKMSQILCDPANERILLLLHESPPREGHTVYTVKLWAYYWKTGEWKSVSNYLPFHESSAKHMTMIDGEIWLNSDIGYGKINQEGNFQPIYLIGFDRHLSDQPIRFGGDNYEKVVLDLSQAMKPDPKYDDLQPNDLLLNVFSGQILLGQRTAMIPKEHRFMRLPEPFRPVACFDGKYCVGYGNQGFQIRTLKDYGK